MLNKRKATKKGRKSQLNIEVVLDSFLLYLHSREVNINETAYLSCRLNQLCNYLTENGLASLRSSRSFYMILPKNHEQHGFLLKKRQVVFCSHVSSSLALYFVMEGFFVLLF